MTLMAHALDALNLTGALVGPEAPLGGSSAPVHRISGADGRVFALRVRPPQQALAIVREASNARLAAELGVGPRVVGVHCGPKVACLLTEWVAGSSLVACLVKEPQRITVWARAAGKFQAAMHDAGRGHPGLGQLDVGWARPHSAAEVHRLQQLPPCDVATLVHLDFHPMNLVVTGDATMAAVDWVNAGVGDRRLDVARTVACMALDGPTQGPFGFWIPAFVATFVQGYEESVGALSDMAPFVRWAAEATLRDVRPKRSPEQVARMEAVARRWDESAAWPPDGASNA